MSSLLSKTTVLWISSTLKSAHALVTGACRVRNQVNLIAKTPDSLSRDVNLNLLLNNVDAIVIVAACTRGFESGMRNLIHAAQTRQIPIAVWAADPNLRADLAHAGSLPADVAEAFEQLMEIGDANALSTVLSLLQAYVKGRSPDIEPPQIPPPAMAYHPQGLKFDGNRPAVAVLFSRRLWTEGDLAGIDAVMFALAKRNLSPFALHVTSRGVDRGSLLKNLIPMIAKKNPQAVLSFTAFSLRNMAQDIEEVKTLLCQLDTPWYVSPVLQKPSSIWKKNPQGLSTRLQTMYVTLPEFDGRISVPPIMARSKAVADRETGIKLAWLKPIKDRCDWVADLISAQVRLRLKPNEKKRVAVVLHNYPPGDGAVGSASGLDGPASALSLLRELSRSGYRVGPLPESTEAFVAALMEGAAPDEGCLTVRRMAAAAGQVSGSQLVGWLSDWPEESVRSMEQAWGKPPGDILVHNDTLPIPGRFWGNVLVAVQPSRGNSAALAEEIHSADLPPNYPLTAFYLWLGKVFDAHAVVHMGKHGCLEWLPGKASGMADSCFPELLLGPMPHFYTYVADSFAEGAAVKRRTHGVVIDHLPPPLRTAGEPAEWAPLIRAVDAARQAVLEKSHRAEQLAAEALAMALELNFHSDLDLTSEQARADAALFVERIHAHLGMLGNTVVSDGLHVLGRPPEGKRLVRLLEILARNAGRPEFNLHGLAVKEFGLDPNDSDQAKRLTSEVKHWIESAMDGRTTGNASIDAALSAIIGNLEPRIKDCAGELNVLLHGLKGGYIAAGPSGSPARGALSVLPTGKNFYGVDPRLLPTPMAWKSGAALGRSLLETYRDEGQPLPETIAMVGFAGNQIRTGGDDLAEALWLMGMRPVWSEPSGFVRDVEPIPLVELGRPRIDVVLRVSGMFRDSLARAIDLIDLAVTKAAALDEPEHQNFIRKHLRRDLTNALREGLRDEEALRRATYRVFSNSPGRYGAGIADRIESGQWGNRDDLGLHFINHGMCAYGRNGDRLEDGKLLKRRLKGVEAVVKNWDRKERDLLDSSDFYSYFGGLNAAVRSERGSDPRLFIGRDTDPSHVRTMGYKEEQQRVFRTHAANSTWLAGMRRHGHAGAAKMAATASNVFGLAATTEKIDSWMFADMARQMLFDSENRRFLEDRNPWAMQTIAGVLMDAVQRGLWETDDQTLTRLEAVFLTADTLLEGPLN